MLIAVSRRESGAEIVAKIKEISAQNIGLCMQCGQCSGTCPMFAAGALSDPPRRIMHLLQLAQVERVTAAQTPWCCAACHACEVRCPRGLDIPRVMEAIRQLTLRRNVDHVHPNTIPAAVLRSAPPIALVAAFRKLTP
jgi:heterodisulfide reductase subunit C